MKELEDFLEEKKELLRTEVEDEDGQVSHGQIDLTKRLVELFPMSHHNIDKMHVIWSRTLRDVLWLGWLTGAKGKNGRYDKEFCESVERSIMSAFMIGKEYSKEKI